MNQTLMKNSQGLWSESVFMVKSLKYTLFVYVDVSDAQTDIKYKTLNAASRFFGHNRGPSGGGANAGTGSPTRDSHQGLDGVLTS